MPEEVPSAMRSPYSPACVLSWPELCSFLPEPDSHTLRVIDRGQRIGDAKLSRIAGISARHQ